MKKYSSEINVQILVSLLKKFGIKKVVASPGTTHLSFVACLQYDNFFEVYSSVDERSAAYLACGMSLETGEPVVITCTGATASRNYLPGLTEAYYRKLPILAVTGTKGHEVLGHLFNQAIDRRVVQNDVIVKSVYAPSVTNDYQRWDCEVKINDALLELTRKGSGPVHIDLQTEYSRDFSVDNLPEVRKITRVGYNDKFPNLPEGRIAIFMGSHKDCTAELTESIDNFCEVNDAVVFCDHTSGYYGKYAVHFALPTYQKYSSSLKDLSLLIHIGEVSGEYGCLGGLNKKQVWRVSPDGEIRDTFKKLTTVFEMEENTFFDYYSKGKSEKKEDYLRLCRKEIGIIEGLIPELPFSNLWIAHQISSKIPVGSVLHLGILNSLRCWNFFAVPVGVRTYSNVGGFGIDGCISTMIGASLMDKKRLYYAVVGDLAFFYDLNSLGNRHINNNIRILLVNNGKGTEFKNFYHTGSTFGEKADDFMAAAGHYGNKSQVLVKHFAQDLGFEYLCALNKDEFQNNAKRFLDANMTSKPLLFEVFTDSVDESDALKIIYNLKVDFKGKVVDSIINLAGGNNAVQKLLGDSGKRIAKKIIRKK